jgi:hypothetical protein
MGKHIMFYDCIPLQNISDIRCVSRRGCMSEKGGCTPPPLHCVRELMYMPIFATFAHATFIISYYFSTNFHAALGYCNVL